MTESLSSITDALQGWRDLPRGLSSEVQLQLGLKRVVRELHDLTEAEAAQSQWETMGFLVLQGEPVQEDCLTGAMVVDTEAEHNAQHLSSHPVVERLVDLGGARVQRLLLSPQSTVLRLVRSGP